MLTKLNLLILAISFCCLSCVNANLNTSSHDNLPATALQPYGRYALNQEKQLEMISSAMHFGFSFEGVECQLFASIPDVNGHNYLQYELDGVYQKRIRLDGNAKEPIRITAPTAGKHTIWVYKATEAHTGPILVSKVAGNKIKTLRKPVGPLIEFIGNSITCGAAADLSEVPCGTGVYHDQHNAYLAYGPRVARTLGANFVLSSVSGIGIYRNWNSNGPTMPQVYGKVNFQENSPQHWNFKTFTPQVVSIALGTNDFSSGDGKNVRLPFDSASYVDNYIKFVQFVKVQYPRAHVALLSSPMINGKNRKTLQNCLTAVKEIVDNSNLADKPIAIYFFQPMQARGCAGHPNVEDHAILAQELIPFFKQLLP